MGKIYYKDKNRNLFIKCPFESYIYVGSYECLRCIEHKQEYVIDNKVYVDCKLKKDIPYRKIIKGILDAKNR